MTNKDKNLLNNPPICPNCNIKTWWNFDMMGPGVWHLHCSNCRILISGYKLNEIVETFYLHHKPLTYIIIRNNNIEIIHEEA